MIQDNNQNVKIHEDKVKIEYDIEKDEAYVYLKELRNEALRKFKKKFPNGAILSSGEFLE